MASVLLLNPIRLMNMRKAFLPFFMLLVLVARAAAQNLVPNPSFEEYTECPSSYPQFDRVAAWESIQGSPDLFNACCVSDTVDVPLNFFGEQAAHDGNGYVGVGTAEMFCKEYMQAALSASLTPHVATFVSMWVSPGGFGIAGTTSPQLVSSGIGLRFSVEPLDYFTAYGEFDFDTAVIFMADVLNDTASWQQLSGIFYPDSAYGYVQIGNFFSDPNTSAEMLDPAGDWECAYAFVDDVCVSQIEGICDVMNGLSPLRAIGLGLEVLSSDGVVSISVGEGRGPLFNIMLIDALGRVHATLPRAEAGITIRLPFVHRSAGLYQVIYQEPNGRVCVTRFLHVQP